jgi:hypothetical protein
MTAAEYHPERQQDLKTPPLLNLRFFPLGQNGNQSGPDLIII